MEDRKLLIMDACVLIDFVEADASILALTARHIGDVHVATPVFDEVRALDAGSATSLGIKLFEPSLETVMDAGAKQGRLSFQDHLCLLIAKAQGWTCVSNDKQLRESCKNANVAVLWGFELLALLVDAKALSPASAKELAEQIARTNKRIGASVLARFNTKIGSKR